MRKVDNQPQTMSIEFTMQHALCGSAGVVATGTPIGGGDDPANGI